MFNTRIAPSPTGDMHVGTARTAYFNWLAARASGGRFVLRIDDTDPARSKQEYVDVIVETMAWLGLGYDEMVRQSNRYERYRSLAASWVKSGLAEEVDGAVRLKLPAADLPTEWKDEIGGPRRITEDDRRNADGTVLIRSDGSPTYNWASVVDDADMGINLVIRGVDHVTNTSKQVILWHLLGTAPPALAHVGLIGIAGKPLSKRDGAASMLSYRERGYHPEAVLNFLARLGWGPTVDDKTTALLPRERMLELFLAGGRMKSGMANMDVAKLDSFDRKHKGRKTPPIV